LKPLSSQWLRLIEPYKSGEWLECIETLRPVVEQFPDDLGTRLLFGALCLATDQPARALVQFEKVLPLAVGQGALFHALAAQKQLDRLKPATAAHDKRFVAIHQWFSAIPARRTETAEGAPLTPAALLSLPPAGFHRVADQAQIEDLGLTAREVEGNAEIARVVLYGRVRWSLVPEGESSILEVVSNELEMVTLAPGLPARVSLRLAPELPAACLRLDLALLRAERAQAGGAQEGRAAGPQKSVAPMSSKHRAIEKRRALRPVPDPRLEPTVAASAPFERRRDSRVSVTFETRVALLGLAGSRVAPFAGRLVNLSPSGLGLGFPRAELMPVREALEGSLLAVELQLPDVEPPVRLMARVRWVELGTPGEGPPDEIGVVGLEFILVSARDHACIQHALIAAARAGQPLDPASGAGAEPDAAAA
jgi:PilZ domain-containing protein